MIFSWINRQTISGVISPKIVNTVVKTLLCLFENRSQAYIATFDSTSGVSLRRDCLSANQWRTRAVFRKPVWKPFEDNFRNSVWDNSGTKLKFQNIHVAWHVLWLHQNNTKYQGCVILFLFHSCLNSFFFLIAKHTALIKLTIYDLANICNPFDHRCRKKIQCWLKTKCQTSCARGHITERNKNTSSNVSSTPGCITCNLNKIFFNIHHWARAGARGTLPPQILLFSLQKYPRYIKYPVGN